MTPHWKFSLACLWITNVSQKRKKTSLFKKTQDIICVQEAHIIKKDISDLLYKNLGEFISAEIEIRNGVVSYINPQLKQEHVLMDE